MGLLTFQLMRRREADTQTEVDDIEQTGEGQEGGTGAAGAGGETTGGAGGTNAGDGNTGGDKGGESPDGNTTSDRLTQEQYEEMIRNKANIMAALKQYGVEYNSRESTEALRAMLAGYVSGNGLLSDGN